MIREENKAKAYFAAIVAMYVSISFILSFVPQKFLTSEMSILLGQSIVIIPGITYCILNKGATFKMIPFKKVSILNVILIVLFTYAIMPIVTLINAISMLFVENQVSDVLSDFNKNPLLLSLFMVAVLPAVFEEFSFRGIIYNGLKTKNVLLALIMSSMLFGIFHMNINQFLYATVLGMVLVLIAEATGSVISAMIMHFTFNANSVILTYLLAWLEDVADEMDMSANAEQIAEETAQVESSLGVVIGVYAVMGMITGTLAFFLFRCIAKRCDRWEHIKSIFTSKKLVKEEKKKLQAQDIVCNILLVMAIIVAILVMIISEIAV